MRRPIKVKTKKEAMKYVKNLGDPQIATPFFEPPYIKKINKKQKEFETRLNYMMAKILEIERKQNDRSTN